MPNKFNLVVCGGTFDHLHKGHESLLKLAFSLGEKVIIGVTSDSFVRSSKLEVRSSKIIEDFEKRKEAVLEFIKKEGVLDKAEIVEINDLFGPVLDKSLAIDAIVVSEVTKKGADIINQKRKELGLNPLQIFVAPIVVAQDGKLISSQRIRNGSVNREGKVYMKPFWFKSDLVLPESLRREFKKPFGKLCQKENFIIEKDYPLVITVGDETTKKFNENSQNQFISVVDFKVARKTQFSTFAELGFIGKEKIIEVNNPPGHITSDLFSKISHIFEQELEQRIILKVTGEEDLAVLPLVLFSPLGTIIYYGQPNKGFVKVVVSEKIKEVVYVLVCKFEMLK